MQLTLVTPEKKLITDLEIDEIIVPGHNGQLDILPGHAPLLTTLQEGVLQYREKGTSEKKGVAVSWGYCEVYPGGVKVLVETAETPDELVKERVEDAVARAQTKLKEGLTVGEAIKYQRKLRRAQARLDLLKKY